MVTETGINGCMEELNQLVTSRPCWVLISAAAEFFNIRPDAYRVRYEMELFVTGSGQTKAVKFSAWAVSCLELYKKSYVKANACSGTYLHPV